MCVLSDARPLDIPEYSTHTKEHADTLAGTPAMALLGNHEASFFTQTSASVREGEKE